MATDAVKMRAQDEARWALENLIYFYADMVNGLAQLESGEVDTLAVLDGGIARRHGEGIDREALEVNARSGGRYTFSVSEETYDAFSDDDYCPPTCAHCETDNEHGYYCGDSYDFLCDRCIYIVNLQMYLL